VTLEPERLTTANFQRVKKCSITGSNVEHRPGRREAIKTTGKPTARAAQDRITDAQEAT
jgi:hypothetical protein